MSTGHGQVAGQCHSVPVIQLEPDPKLAHLLCRTRRQTIFWYLRSKPVVAAGALAATILAVSLWFGMGSSARSPAHHHLTRLAQPTAPPTVPSGFGSARGRTAPRRPLPSPTAVAPRPTTKPGFAYAATVHCPAPVTLVVTGTGTGTNILHISGPGATRDASGDDIVLSVTGPGGTYKLVDSDSGGHPGVFWAAHGSICAAS
jgi:hypothetical protein